MIGYIFNGISAYYSVYPSVSNKSYHILISEMAAFGVNVLLNIILIPKIGIMGAALATAAGFLVGAGYLFIISRREIIIEYQIKDLIIIVFAALVFLYLGMHAENFLLDIMLILFYLFILHFFTKININKIFRMA
jgi:O-antigen/teichoic acid export membrane protein